VKDTSDAKRNERLCHRFWGAAPPRPFRGDALPGDAGPPTTVHLCPSLLQLCCSSPSCSSPVPQQGAKVEAAACSFVFGRCTWERGGKYSETLKKEGLADYPCRQLRLRLEYQLQVWFIGCALASAFAAWHVVVPCLIARPCPASGNRKEAFAYLFFRSIINGSVSPFC